VIAHNRRVFVFLPRQAVCDHPICRLFVAVGNELTNTGIRDTVHGVASRLRAGWSEVRIRAGARVFSKTLHTGFKAHPASYSVGTGVLLPGGKAAGASISHLCLVPRLIISEARSLLLLCYFMAWTGTSFFTFRRNSDLLWVPIRRVRCTCRTFLCKVGY
jgi:hypothetical protein